MEIRPATVNDVPEVLPMVAEVCALHETWDPAKFGYRQNPQEMYRGWLASRAVDPHSVFLVAQREGHLVAFLVATVEKEIPVYRLKEFGFIHDLWVEPQYRNEGIARQLVMLCLEKFRAINVPQVRCDTAAVNEPARGLVKSCGFRESVVEMLVEL